MQVSTPSFAAALRMVERNAKDAEPASDAALPDQALLLEDFVRNAAESRKEFARERLAQLKEQMTTLMLFSMKPDALKHLSAQFGRELENAATDFSRAVRTLSDRQTGFAGQSAEEIYLGADEPAAALGPGFSDEDRETANGFLGAAAMINSLVEISTGPNADLEDRRTARRTRQSLDNVVAMMTRLDTRGMLDPVYW